MGKEISRRGFLSGVATAGAMAVIGGVTGCNSAGASDTKETSAEASKSGKHTWDVAPEAITDIAEEKDYDIVIVGAGVSGCAAAEAAAEGGAKVAIVEQASGFTAHGADNGAIGTRMQASQGISIDPYEATRMLYKWGHEESNRDLIWTWASKSGAVFDHFNDLADEIGLGCIPAISSTTKVDWYENEPDFRIFRTGCTFGSSDESIVIDTTHFTFIQSHFVEMLINKAVDLGAEVFYNTHAEQLIGGNGSAVTGVVVTSEDGKHVQYNASEGVILATGDISGNEEMLTCWSPIVTRADQVQYFPAGGNLGEGILMGMWAGAARGKSSPAPMIHPVTTGSVLGPIDCSWLAVNSDGNRYGCEVPIEPMITNSRMNQPGNTGYYIFDSKYEERVMAQEPITGQNILAGASDSIAGYVKDGTMFQADTITDLATQIGVPVNALEATVDRYNSLCASGEDVDYGVPARFLAAVEQPPYYAAKIPAVTLVVPYGLHVDKNSQVCTDDDEPIEGLYAVGNCQGDFFACSYPVICPGISHGRAATFGWLVGDALAKGTTING